MFITNTNEGTGKITDLLGTVIIQCENGYAIHKKIKAG